MKGKSAINFWSNPIMLMPNRGSTKNTTVAITNPRNRGGSKLGGLGLAPASTTSPSITPSSCLLENNLETNMPKAIASANIIINFRMGFAPKWNGKAITLAFTGKDWAYVCKFNCPWGNFNEPLWRCVLFIKSLFQTIQIKNGSLERGNPISLTVT